MKTTGHEVRVSVRVSVCLTAKADGTRLKPFIVFAGAKRECKGLNEEFKSRCVIASSPNAWMNEELTLTYVNSIIGRFAFNRRLLSRDSFECHITNSVREILKDFNVDDVNVSGECSSHTSRHPMCHGTNHLKRMLPMNVRNGLAQVFTNTQHLEHESTSKKKNSKIDFGFME